MCVDDNEQHFNLWWPNRFSSFEEERTIIDSIQFNGDFINILLELCFMNFNSKVFDIYLTQSARYRL